MGCVCVGGRGGGAWGGGVPLRPGDHGDRGGEITTLRAGPARQTTNLCCKGPDEHGSIGLIISTARQRARLIGLHLGTCAQVAHNLFRFPEQTMQILILAALNLTIFSTALPIKCPVEIPGISTMPIFKCMSNWQSCLIILSSQIP